MRIEVAVHPREIEYISLQGKTVVVYDVLRASSTITAALAAGAAGVCPVLEPQEALAKKALHDNALLGGERGGVKIPGFDLGNSPLEYEPARVQGKLLIMTTTNGTKALQAAAAGKEVYVGSLLNGPTLAEHIWNHNPGDVVLFCAGENGRTALEDLLGAGYLAYDLHGRGAQLADDGARLAYEHYLRCQAGLPGVMEEFHHSVELIELGFGRDVEYCAQVGLLDVVPRLEAGVVRRV
ncbi:MAG: 2-phosphosulfolactate phosphatase [Limnochordia bacterium]|jgi:2-phosphosulfolactate phosphatase